MYSIQPGIPMPPPKHEHKYPFNDMKVGDSFSVPLEEHRRAYRAAMQQNAQTDRKFSIRKLPDEARIWRIK